MSTTGGPIHSAKLLIGRRPAETATATAAAVGLLLSQLFNGADDDFTTGLVILVAAVPAVVSYVHDLGRLRHLPHDLALEVGELALRAVRRARLDHPGWESDVDRAKALAALLKELRPPTTGESKQEVPAAKPDAGAGAR